MVPEVFVVDDDEPVRRALDRLLRCAGYRVKAFGSSVDLLCEIERSLPSCLIIDVRMPFIDGLELFETLRWASIQVPVVFITGHGDVTMAARAIENGAVEFLSKPFDDEALLRAVQLGISRNGADGQ